jgi:hypothetical protein
MVPPTCCPPHRCCGVKPDYSKFARLDKILHRIFSIHLRLNMVNHESVFTLQRSQTLVLEALFDDSQSLEPDGPAGTLARNLASKSLGLPVAGASDTFNMVDPKYQSETTNAILPISLFTARNYLVRSPFSVIVIVVDSFAPALLRLLILLAYHLFQSTSLQSFPTYYPGSVPASILSSLVDGEPCICLLSTLCDEYDDATPPGAMDDVIELAWSSLKVPRVKAQHWIRWCERGIAEGRLRQACWRSKKWKTQVKALIAIFQKRWDEEWKRSTLDTLVPDCIEQLEWMGGVRLFEMSRRVNKDFQVDGYLSAHAFNTFGYMMAEPKYSGESLLDPSLLETVKVEVRLFAVARARDGRADRSLL